MRFSAPLTVAAAVSHTVPRSAPAVWIISRRDDLTWFIGSSLAGYGAIALMAFGFPLLPLQLVWMFGVDGPHVLSTITRTYFDREERKSLGWFLWIVCPLLLVGPLMALMGWATLFFLVAFCWQQFHVAKQHLGFAMMYKGKNRERDQTDRTLDRWFLLASLGVPLTLFVAKTQWPLPSQALPTVSGALLAGYGALMVVWLTRQGQKLRVGAEMNWPKLALFAGVVPLQWLAFSFATKFGASGTLQAAIPLGLFHGLQYHRLMWFHNHNRYSLPGALERNGLAARLATHVWVYLGVAIGLHFLVAFLIPQMFAVQTAYGSQLLQAAIWGVAFTHYCLDARIWHVRNDKPLAVALRMA